MAAVVACIDHHGRCTAGVGEIAGVDLDASMGVCSRLYIG
jgi:hypothetical protein